jgi:hypothetical protein
MFNPFVTSTVDGIAKSGQSLELSHGKLHIQSAYTSPAGDKIIINYTSILDKYYDYLQKIVVSVTFTDEEYLKYRFQPKRFCMDFYDTTELWSSILRLNNMTSASQFVNQTIKAFTKDVFVVINEIMILEEERIRHNRFDVYGK